MNKVMDFEKREKIAFILKTIAHPIRIGIIELLTRNKSLSVNEICDGINCEQSLISHHLATMRLKGILGYSKSGKKVYYSIRFKEVTNVIDCIEHCNVGNISIN